LVMNGISRQTGAQIGEQLELDFQINAACPLAR
jgi:hypothetical protein